MDKNEDWLALTDDASIIEQAMHRHHIKKAHRPHVRAVLEDALATARALLQRRAQEIETLRALLRRHHHAHLNAGNVGLPDGEGGYVELDMTSEYTESRLFAATLEALDQ